MEELGILIKAVLEKSEADIRRQLDELREVVRRQPPISIPFSVDESGLAAAKKAASETRAAMEDAARKGAAAQKDETAAVSDFIRAYQEKARYLKERNADLFRDMPALAKQLGDFESNLNALDSSSGIKDLRHEFTVLGHDVSIAKGQAQGLGNELQNTFKKVSLFLGVGSAVALLARELRNGVKAVMELDKAMTDLVIVTGMGKQQAMETIALYNRMGVELGVSTKAVADGAQVWLHQGKSLDETNRLIEISTKFARVAMMDSADAANVLTAAMNGLGLSIDEVAGLTDKFNAVDLGWAVSAKELGTAFQYVASVAKQAGVDVDKLIGLIAAAESSTRLGAEQIGNALRSVIARMQNVKVGKFIDDETGENLNDVLKVLGKLDIAVVDAAGNWRDFGDVIDEVGGRWDEFNQTQQNAIVTAMAGVRQSNILRAVFESYDEVLRATAVSQEAAGTTAQKFGAIVESIDYKVNRFKESLVALWQNLMDSSAIKGVVDAGTGIVKVLDAIVPIVTSLPGQIALVTLAVVKLAAPLAALAFGKLVSGIAGFADALVHLPGLFAAAAQNGQGLNGVLRTLGFTAGTAQLAFTGLFAAVAIGAVAYSNWKRAQEEARQAALDFGRATEDQLKAIDELKDKLRDESLSRESLIGLISEHSDKYGEEVSALNDVNEARERALELLDEEAKKRAEEAVRQTKGEYYKAVDFLENGYNGTSVSPEKTLETYKKLIDDYEKYNDKMNGGWDQGIYYSLENLTKQYAKLSKEIEESQAAIETHARAVYESEGSLDSFAGSVGLVAEAVQRVAKSASDAGESLEQTGETLGGAAKGPIEDYADAMTSLAEKVSLLKAAQSELGKNGEVSQATLTKLKKAGMDYSDALDIVNGKLFLNIDALKQSAVAQDETNKIEEESARLAANWLELVGLRAQWIEASRSGNEVEADAIAGTIRALEEENSALQANIAGRREQLDGLGETSSAHAAFASALQELSDSASFWNAAQKEMAQTGTLSLSTLQKIVATGDDFMKYLDVSTGKIELNREAFNSLIQEKVNDVAETARLMGATDDFIEILEAWAAETENAVMKQQLLTNALGDFGKGATIYKTAQKEMAQAGQISFQTLGQLIGSTDRFMEALDLSNNKLKINAQAYLKLQVDQLALVLAQGALNLSTEQQTAILDAAKNSLEEFADEARTAADELKSMDSAYRTISSAMEEYNEKGEISVSTLLGLLDLSPEYLSALDLQNGRLSINRERLAELSRALEKESQEKLASAFAADIQALASGNMADASDIAKSAIGEMGGAAATSAGDFATLADEIIDAAVAESLLSEGFDEERFRRQADLVKAKYLEIIKMKKELLDVTDFSDIGSSSKSGGSGKSNEDPWKEEFERRSKDLKYRLDMDLISESRYYDELEGLNRKYFANRAQYLDEYRRYEVEVYGGRKKLEEAAAREAEKAAQEAQRAADDASGEAVKGLEAQLEKTGDIVAFRQELLRLSREENISLEQKERILEKIADLDKSALGKAIAGIEFRELSIGKDDYDALIETTKEKIAETQRAIRRFVADGWSEDSDAVREMIAKNIAYASQIDDYVARGIEKRYNDAMANIDFAEHFAPYAEFDEFIGYAREKIAAANAALAELLSGGFGKDSEEARKYYRVIEDEENKIYDIVKKKNEHELTALRHNRAIYESLSPEGTDPDALIASYKAEQEMLHSMANDRREFLREFEGLTAEQIEADDEIQARQRDWMARQQDILAATRQKLSLWLEDLKAPVLSMEATGADRREAVEAWRSVLGEIEEAKKEYLGRTDAFAKEMLNTLEDEAKKAKAAILGALDDVLKNSKEALGSLRNAYSDLLDAAETYAANGAISVGQYEKIISLGFEYIDLLENENGQLVFSKKNIEELIRVRGEQVAVQTALNLLERVKNVLLGESDEKMEDIIKSTNDLKVETWDLVYAELAHLRTLGATEEQMAALTKQITTLQQLAGGFAVNLDETARKMSEMAESYDAAIGVASRAIQREIDMIEKANKALSDQAGALKEAKAGWETTLSYVLYLIDREIAGVEKLNSALKDDVSALGDTKNNLTATMSAATGIIDDQIRALQEQKKALQDKNNEEERALKLAQLQLDLEKARQKTQRVYVEGQGWTWQADIDGIGKAQQALDEFYRQDDIGEIDKKIAEWQAQRDLWANIVSDYQQNQNLLLALEVYGKDFEAKILSMQSQTMAEFVAGRYSDTMAQIELKEKEIKANEEKIKSWREYRDVYAKITDDLKRESDRQVAISRAGYDFEHEIVSLRKTDLADLIRSQIEFADKQIEQKEREIAANSERIASLQELKSEWDSIAKNYKDAQDDMNAALQFGADFEKGVLQGRLAFLKDFVSEYNKEMDRLKAAPTDNVVAGSPSSGGGTTSGTTGDSGGTTGGASGSSGGGNSSAGGNDLMMYLGSPGFPTLAQLNAAKATMKANSEEWARLEKEKPYDYKALQAALHAANQAIAESELFKNLIYYNAAEGRWYYKEQWWNAYRKEFYHKGGLVGADGESGGPASINPSTEVFAQLLKGEFVSTPYQMDLFVSRTLPQLAARMGQSVSIGDIHIHNPIGSADALASEIVRSVRSGGLQRAFAR